MEKLDGFELPALLLQAQAEFRVEQERKIREKILHILGKTGTQRGSIASLERQLQKAKDALEKEQQKLVQLAQGNWSVLAEDKEETNGPQYL